MDSNSVVYNGIIKGLTYEEDFISEEEEQELIETVNGLEWTNLLKRRVQHHGYSYDYIKKKIEKKGPLPKELQAITERVSKHLLEDGQLFNQIIVNEYLPGQGIAAHTDLYQLGDIVACISLGSAVIMDFSHMNGDFYPVQLNRRSLLVMRDDARYMWKHAIASRKSDILLLDDGTEKRVKRGTRISITFRLVPTD